MANKKSGSKPRHAPNKKGNASTHGLKLDEASDKRNSPAQSLQPSSPTQGQSTPHEGDTTQATSGPENQAVESVPMRRWKEEKPEDSYYTHIRGSRAKCLEEPEISNLVISDDEELQESERHSAHGDKDAKRGSAQRA
ncbi:hypothetical protein ACHAPJ_001175 [Fusarium lateritium]